jgi:hypothetical protein
MPSSHELGDRSARAGAAPGRVPVRGRRRCGTALTQQFSQDSAVVVASPGSTIQALARLGMRPWLRCSTRGIDDGHNMHVWLVQPSDRDGRRDRSGRSLVPSPSPPSSHRSHGIPNKHQPVLPFCFCCAVMLIRTSASTPC